MALPENFSSQPNGEPHRYFRNLIIEFKKKVQYGADLNELQKDMDNFLDVCKQLDWGHKSSGTYSKPVGEKACQKVWEAFDRYFKDQARPQDLIDALTEVERLVNNFKAK